MNMKQAMLIVTLGFSSGAFAADPGFYVGGGGGHARHSDGLVGQIEDALARSTGYELLSADLVDDSDTAWKLFAGYRFGNGFGLEASYVDLGSVVSRYHMRVISIMQPSPDFLVDGHYDLEAWGISAFYEWEFSPTFSASVRAGMFNASQDYFQRNTTIYEYPDFSHSSDDTVPGFGLGLNWRVTPSVDLRLDHDRYQGIGKRFGFDAEDTNGRFDVGVTSLNLAVRFGR
ncbi:MAG: outer membrane beta-barrel protein [Lysobacteraceae bacterium]